MTRPRRHRTPDVTTTVVWRGAQGVPSRKVERRVRRVCVDDARLTTLTLSRSAPIVEITDTDLPILARLPLLPSNQRHRYPMLPADELLAGDLWANPDRST